MCRPRSFSRPDATAPRTTPRASASPASGSNLWNDVRALAERALRDAGPRRLAAFGLIGLAALSVLPGWFLVPALATAGFALLGWHPFAWMSCGSERSADREGDPAAVATSTSPAAPAASAEAADAPGPAGRTAPPTPTPVVVVPTSPAPPTPSAERADAA